MPYGQGSVKQDARSGKWKARYYDPEGRQRCKSGFETKTAAREFLATVTADKLRGNWIDPSGSEMSFGTWAEEWFAGKHNLGDAARDRDGILLRKHILPTFGARPIGKITALEVRKWVGELVASGLSPRTVHPTHRIFCSIMRAAVAAKLIPDAPIGRGVVDLPKIRRKAERFLTELEVERLALAVPEYYRAVVFTLAYTGCRWQEVAGLKREYLDLEAGILHVHGVFKRSKGRVYWAEHPKSEAGRRSISLPRRLVAILRRHLDDASPSEFVFTGPDGGILRETSFRRKWHPAVAAAGLEPLTPHDLRHTHAAWLIAPPTSATPLVVQRRLGHKSIRTTMDVYGHLFPNAEESLVERLDERWEAAEAENAKVFLLPA